MLNFRHDITVELSHPFSSPFRYTFLNLNAQEDGDVTDYSAWTDYGLFFIRRLDALVATDVEYGGFDGHDGVQLDWACRRCLCLQVGGVRS